MGGRAGDSRRPRPEPCRAYAGLALSPRWSSSSSMLYAWEHDVEAFKRRRWLTRSLSERKIVCARESEPHAEACTGDMHYGLAEAADRTTAPFGGGVSFRNPQD